MGVAYIDLEVRAVSFAQAILSSLRRNPRCLPPPVAGLQLQRVRFRAASVRNVKQASYIVWQQQGSHDQGVGFEWIRGVTPQLAVAITADLAPVVAIAGQPNTLVVTESHDATLVFDLDCKPAAPPTSLEFSVTLTDVETASGLVSGGGPAANWLFNQVNALLAAQPFRLDLGATLAPGVSFLNAGIAADITGQRLVVRGQVPMGANTVTAWRNFQNGNIPNRLGPHDWAVFLRAEDLKATLQSAVWGPIAAALKEQDVRLITVSVNYAAQPSQAVFTITPVLDVPVVGIESLPASVVLSYDAAGGRLIADVDLYGLRDRVGDLVDLAAIILNIIVPGLGVLVRGVLNDLVAGASAEVTAAGTSALAGAPPGTTFLELPGEPFRYRATIPVALPNGVQGRIAAIDATPDGVIIAGTWSVLNFRESELEVQGARFIWRAPSVACGESGNAVLRDITVHPELYAWLSATIGFDQSGSAPIRVCSATVIQGPDATAGLTLSWTADRLPTTVELRAPYSLLGLNLAQPILVEIRTTAGVVIAAIPPPQPLMPKDLQWLRESVKLQLIWCDSVVVAEWFNGKEKFDVGWIVDPLLDPDYAQRILDLITIEVGGLAAGSTLVVRQGETMVGRALEVAGQARLDFAVRAGEPAPSLAIEVTSDAPAAPGAGSFAVLRERWEAEASLALRGVTAVTASHQLLPGHFLASHPSGVFLIDARNFGAFGVARHWAVPGVRGVVETLAGLRAFGEAGLFDLPLNPAAVRPTRLLDVPVADAVPFAGGLALATPERVVLVNAHGARLAETAARGVRGLLPEGRAMLAVDAEGASAIGFGDAAPSQRHRGLAGAQVLRSAIGRSVFLAQPGEGFVHLRRGGNDWEASAVLTELPVAARAARSGRNLLDVEPERLMLYRHVSGPERLAPPTQEAAVASRA